MPGEHLQARLGASRGTGGGVHLSQETAGGDLFACAPSNCANTKRLIAHEDALALEWSLEGHTAFATDEAVYWAAVDAPDGGASAADAGADASGARARIMRAR